MGNGMNHCHDGDVKTNQWLTPPDIIKSLGVFDLDPATPIVRPWDTALHHFNIIDDGLRQEWFGRVWLNPPYDSKTIDLWMRKMADHNNGVALLFARTDRNTFHDHIFPFADSILFVKQRFVFHDVYGVRAKANGGAPSVLIGYGELNSDAIANSGVKGKHILLNRIGVVVIGLDQTWQVVIKSALINLNNEADLNTIYEEIERIAPGKVEKNKHYKAKIRQKLQSHFSKVSRGTYRAAA